MYPEGYTPKWWECPECKERWHDSEQEFPEMFTESGDWDAPPLCDVCGYIEMVPVEEPHGTEKAK